MKKIICVSIAALLLACGSPVKKEMLDNTGELTDRQLWSFHKDIRYTYFYYVDGSIKEGLLLRWKPDSILVQPRGVDLPKKIPTAGIKSLRVEIGNKVWKGFVIGALAAGVYALVMKSNELTGASWAEAGVKLLGPPAILAGSVAVGSGWYEYENYRLPDGFQFDLDRVKSLYETLE